MQEVIKHETQSISQTPDNNEVAREKYLQPILEVLDRKNIRGARLLKQGNQVMLLIDKSKLNSMNMKIANTMNMVYPNHVVCINNIGNPFDYEGLYEDNSFKQNKKVRPYKVFKKRWGENSDYLEYFKDYSYAGIVLDTNKLSQFLQLGYFLEFVNTFQTQNPLEQEEIQIRKGVEVYSPETLRRYDEYIKQGCPDKQPLTILIKYNEDIQDDMSEGLELKNDPYFNRIAIINFNGKEGVIYDFMMELSQSRMEANVKNYIVSKQHKSNEGHSIQGDDIFESAQIPEAPSTSGIPEL